MFQTARRIHCTLLLAACATLALPAARAADTPSPAPAPAKAAVATDPLGGVRAHVHARRWSAALDELRRIDAKADADWNNLMGYVLRKQPQPDLDGAQRHYDAALRINPQHAGALEYSGELALMRGDLATAEARLATLGKVCTSPCEPLDDLRKAITRYKGNGGKL